MGSSPQGTSPHRRKQKIFYADLSRRSVAKTDDVEQQTPIAQNLELLADSKTTARLTSLMRRPAVISPRDSVGGYRQPVKFREGFGIAFTFFQDIMLGTVTHHPGSFVTYHSGSYLAWRY